MLGQSSTEASHVFSLKPNFAPHFWVFRSLVILLFFSTDFVGLLCLDHFTRINSFFSFPPSFTLSLFGGEEKRGSPAREIEFPIPVLSMAEERVKVQNWHSTKVPIPVLSTVVSVGL